MYQIKAVLSNQAKPELGVVTVPFPIPWQEYEQTLELLKGLEIGASVGQDCQVETIDSYYSILKRLEGTPVNLDDLDYLAKRLDSFDVYEALQFQAAAAANGISSIQDFIDLTFCCRQVTVVQDFSQRVREWADARNIPPGELDRGYTLNAHSVVVNGFARQYLQTVEEMAREAMAEVEGQEQSFPEMTL